MKPIPLILFLSLSTLGACVFDTRGLLSQDGRRKDAPHDFSPPLPDQRHDLSVADLKPDHPALPSDLAFDPECAGSTLPYACRSAEGDAGVISFGQSGLCTSGKFQPLRYCFEHAPCKNGLCAPDGCTSCSETPCSNPNEACTLLLVNSGSDQRVCCVGRSPKGNGSLGDSCNSNLDCANQLCTLGSKKCTEPCSSVNPLRCPAGFSCATVTVQIGLNAQQITGCAKLPLDAGPSDVFLPDKAIQDQTTSGDLSLFDALPLPDGRLDL
jgi:hypothetical protein